MLSYKQILDKIDQLEEAHVLMAALELGIYSVLEKKWMTAKAVSGKAGTNREGTAALLNALAAMGALRKRGDRFANTSETYRHFCASSPHYKKGTVMLRKENRDEWGALLNVIRNGRDLSQYESGDDAEFRNFFTYAMHERSEAHAGKVARIVARRRVGRMLDLGGGPGSYSAAVLRKDNQASAIVLDRKPAIRVASKIHQKTGIFRRLGFIAGDLFLTDYGKSYDTVFYSNILHIYNPVENRKLFRKIHMVLNPGGRFIIADLFLKDNLLEPYDAALFSLTMLLFTKTGKTYTFTETEKLLRATGFGDFKRFKLDAGSSLIEAVKK